MKVEQQGLGADECETLFIFAIIKVIPLESFAQLAASMPLKKGGVTELVFDLRAGNSKGVFLVAGKLFENINDLQKNFR